MAKETANRRGETAFDLHFASIYGERWPSLKEALSAPSRTENHLEGLLKPYYLDRASVEAAKALDVHPGHKVLDLCAAPGGKTLALALALAGTGSLISNDRSADRRERLRRVVEEHLPLEFRSNLRITGHDATTWGLHEKGIYDRILLDAPCSSERHLMHSPSHLAQWSPARTRSLARQAMAMLCAALEALKPGGQLLYSTCSISPEENEDLVSKFALKRRGLWDRMDQRMIMPDRNGEGPLFWTLIQKSR